MGVGLLFVGLVDLAILGALRRILEPDRGMSVTVQRADGPTINFNGYDEASLALMLGALDHQTSPDVAEQLRELSAAIERLNATVNGRNE